MNAPVLLAQLSGVAQNPSPTPKILKIEKPATGQALTFHLDGNARLDLGDIASEKLTFVRVGDKLIVLFDNQSTVTVDPVFDAATGNPLPDIGFQVGDDRVITGDQFATLFPISTDQSILPAAGNSGPASGADFHDAQIGALGAGGTPLGLLGDETSGGQQFSTQDTGFAGIVFGTATTGELDDEGLTGGLIDGPGDAPGSATSVTGNLNIDFGSVGVSGASLAFATTQSGLSGLTSGGEPINLLVSNLPGGTPTIIGFVGGNPNADGSHVFEIALNLSTSTGQYTFTLLRPLDHPGANTEDTLNLVIEYTASNTSGTFASAFGVNVNDDSPAIDPDGFDQPLSTQGSEGSEGSQGGLSVPHDDVTDPVDGDTSVRGGTLGILWGADSFNTNPDGGVLDATGQAGDRSLVFTDATIDLSSGETSLTNNLSSHGAPVQFVLAENGTLLIAFAGGESPSEENRVFTVKLSDVDSGSYVFTQYQELDHVGTSGEQQQINLGSLDLTFNYTATDSDGDAVSGSFNVTVNDDAPQIYVEGVQNGNVAEDGFENGNPGDTYTQSQGFDNLTFTGNLGVAWGADDNNIGPLANRSLTFEGITDGQDATDHNGQTITSHDQAVHYHLVMDGGQSALIGYTGDAPADDQSNWVFKVELDDSSDAGSYTFTLLKPIDHPMENSEDNIILDFDFTAADADQDTATGSFSVSINDDAPAQAGEPIVGTADEDDLADSFYSWVGEFWQGSLGTSPYDGSNGDQSDTSLLGTVSVGGNLSSLVNPGADGPGAFHLVSESQAKSVLAQIGPIGGALHSKGDAVNNVHAIDIPGIGEAMGFFASDGRLVAGLFVGEDGTYDFRLLDQLDHPIGDNPSTSLAEAVQDALNVDLSGFVTYTDFDGDTITLAPGQFSINVIDDVPVVTITTNGVVSVDETGGGDNLSSLFGGVTNAGSDPDMAGPVYASGHLIDATAQGGADEPGSSKTLSLHIDAQDSGLTTTDGQHIHLHRVSDTLVVGEVGDTGEAAFAVTIDQSGNVSVAQYLSLHHGNGNTPDDAVDLNGKLSAVVTVTDYDGDTVSETTPIGDNIRFLDDGPVVPLAAPSVAIDEDNRIVPGTELHDASVTQNLGIDWGADGRGTFALTSEVDVSGIPSGTTLHANGQLVQYTLLGAVLVGFIGDAIADDNVVFTVTIDPANNGSYTFTLKQPLDHSGDAGTPIALGFHLDSTDGDGDDASTTFQVVIDPAGNPSAGDYSNLHTGVFVNLDTHEHEFGGQTVGAHTATDVNGQGPAVGVDTVGGLVAIGGDGDDILVGSSSGDYTAKNTLSGVGGDDHLVVVPDIVVPQGFGTAIRTFDHGDGSSEQVNITGMAGEGDALHGGAGEDTAQFDLGNTDATGFVFDRASFPGSLELDGVERFVGTDGNDVIMLPTGYTADGSGVTVDGGQGDDIISGADGSEALIGGEGNDKIAGLGGSDEIHGNRGDDTIWGGSGDDVIHGDEGNDTVHYALGSGSDVIDGGADSDTLKVTTPDGAGPLIEYVKAAGTEIVLTPTQMNATPAPAPYNATLTARNVETLDFDLKNGNWLVFGQGGSDLGAAAVTDVKVTGDDTNTSLWFANVSSATRLDATLGGGNDTYVGGGQSVNQTVDGGAGIDSINFSQINQRFDIDLDTGVTERMTYGGDHVATDSLTHFENATGSFGADTIRGTSDANVLSGGGGNDTLEGRGGDDTLNGGNGFDTAVYGGSLSGYQVSLHSGGSITVTDTDASNGNDGTDTLAGIESIQFGGPGAVTLDLTAPVRLFDGDPGNGGHLIGTYATIQAAVDAVSGAGQFITLAAGTYTESVTVDHGVTILGAEHGDPVAGRDPAGTGSESVINGQWIIATGDAVKLDGLYFKNVSPEGVTSDATLSILTGGAGSGHVITNTIFYSDLDGGDKAIAGADGDGARDDRAIFVSNQASSGHITIEDNLITGLGGKYGDAAWGRGVWSDGGGADLTISGNTFESVRSGLNLDDNTPNSPVHVTDNTFNGAGTAISLGDQWSGNLDGTFSGNNFNNVDLEFNFGNLSQGVTLHADGAIGSRDATDLTTYIVGGSGGDVIGGTSGNDLIQGGAGADRISGGAGQNVLIGGSGNEQFFATGGDDKIYGNSYAASPTGDNLNATPGESDTVYYGNQADFQITQNIDGSWNVAEAGGGNVDTLYGIEGINFNGGSTIELDFTAPVRLFDGANNLIGTFQSIQAANNSSAASDGDRIVISGTIVGGEQATLTHNDLTVEGQTDDVGIVLTLGAGVTELTLAGNAPIEVVGNGLANIINGNDGANRIVGGLGADTLDGGAGDDVLVDGGGTHFIGGDGIDRVDLSQLTGRVDINMHLTAGSGGYAAHAATLTGIENLTLNVTDHSGGSASNVTGNEVANEIIGSGRSDNINGLAGNDRIYGNDGDDTIAGGAGQDVLDGGNGNNTLLLSVGAQSSVIHHVNLTDNQVSGGELDGDTISNFDNVTAAHNATADFIGNGHANILTGGNNNDVLHGMGGDDTLIGDLGYSGTANADILVGGDGDDTLIGGGGNDQLYGNDDTAPLAVSDINPAAGERDTALYSGSESGYSISLNSNGMFTVTDTNASNADEGVDTLAGIESIQFGTGPGAVTRDLTAPVRLFDGDPENGGHLIGTYSTIQAAVNAVSGAGQFITLAAGIYPENVTVNHGVTILGSGPGTVIEGTFLTDNEVGTGATAVKDFLNGSVSYDGSAGAAFTIAADDVTIKDLVITGYNVGIELDDGSDTLTQTVIENVAISHGIEGIHKADTTGIDGMTIRGVSMTDGHIGIDFAKVTTSATQGMATNVTIDDSHFTHLTEKGIYLESFDQSEITDIRMNDVGTVGRTEAFGNEPQIGDFGTGIELNLKAGSYSGIVIDGFTLTDVGTADEGHGAAIGVKVRNDGAYAGVPATYSGDVTIKNGSIDHTSTGVRLGEPDRPATGIDIDLTNVSIINATYDADNVSDTHVLTVTLPDGSAGVTADNIFIVNPATTIGSVIVNGNDNGDAISTGAGTDTLNGGTGDDVLAGGAGNDQLNGGAGFDTASYKNDTGPYGIIANLTTAAIATTLVTGSSVTAAAGKVYDASGSVDTLNDIERVVGTGTTDAIYGGAGGQTLEGAGGDDYIRGGSGNDILIGGDGNDTLAASAGDDTLDGGNGNDTFQVSQNFGGTHVFMGGDGNDTIQLQQAGTIAVIKGDFGAANRIEHVVGTVNGNQLSVLTGDSEGNTLDFRQTILSNVLVSGGGGDDTIFASMLSNTLLNAEGGGHDIFHGSTTDTVYRVSNNVNGATQIFDGGAGNDKIELLQAGTNAHLVGDFNNGGNADSNSNSIEEIQGVTVGGSTSHMIGDNNNNVLNFTNVELTDVIVGGGAGDDTIYASNESNTVISADGGGHDVFHGSSQDTRYLVSNNAAGATGEFHGGAGTDIIELQQVGTNYVLAGNFDATNSIEEIQGTANGTSTSTLLGDGNANTLDFRASKLTNIAINAGGGADEVYVSQAPSPVSYNGGSGTDTLHIVLSQDQLFNASLLNQIAALTPGSGANGSVDDPSMKFTATSFENIVVQVQAGDDLIGLDALQPLVGSANHNAPGYAPELDATDDTHSWAIAGLGGDDVMNGGAKNDVLIGGIGTDTMDGRGGSDTYLVGPGEGFDWFRDSGAANDGIDRIVATADNTQIGIRSAFDGPNDHRMHGIEEISSGGHANVTIVGSSSVHSVLDLSGVKLEGISLVSMPGGTSNDEIWTSNNSDAAGGQSYQGGAGNDMFHLGIQGANFLVSPGDAGYDSFTGNSLSAVHMVKALADDTNIGLGTAYGNNVDHSNSVDEITASGHDGVRIVGSGDHNVWDFSETALTGITEIATFGGNDSIIGSSGDDRINGGIGHDTLKGGGGADTFVYTEGSGNADTILDYDGAEQDKLDLSGLLSNIDSQDIANHLHLENNGNNVIVQINTGGGQNWSDVATLQNYHTVNNEVLVQFDNQVHHLTVTA